MGVSLLENKAELQLVEIAFFDRPIMIMRHTDRHVDRLTDSENMISNVQTTPWHWYSVQGLLK